MSILRWLPLLVAAGRTKHFLLESSCSHENVTHSGIERALAKCVYVACVHPLEVFGHAIALSSPAGEPSLKSLGRKVTSI